MEQFVSLEEFRSTKQIHTIDNIGRGDFPRLHLFHEYLAPAAVTSGKDLTWTAFARSFVDTPTLGYELFEVDRSRMVVACSKILRLVLWALPCHRQIEGLDARVVLQVFIETLQAARRQGGLFHYLKLFVSLIYIPLT